MQRFESLKLLIVVFATWLTSLLSFSFVTPSHWTILLLTLFLLVCAPLPRASRILLLLVGALCFMFFLVRLELAQRETQKLFEAVPNPATFEIASDPEGIASFAGETYAMNANVLTPAGELLVRLNDPLLHNARISSRWTCTLDLEVSPINKRYRAFAQCEDEPVEVENQNNLQRLGDSFRSTLQQLTGGRNTSLGAQLLPGLVVGDTSQQSAYLEDILRESGLGHLTAVSGANVAIVLVAVTLLLKRTRISRLYRLVLLLLVLGAYLVVVRPEPSVVRASAMAVIALGYWFLGLQKHGEATLLVSVVLLLLVDPWLALSWGFALSVSATFGLIVLPRVFGITPRDHWSKKAIGVALSAGIATFPILVAMGTDPSFASILANVCAEVFVAPATILGLVAALIGTLRFLPIVGAYFEQIGAFVADSAIASAQAICWIAEFALASWLHIPVLSYTGFALALLVVLLWRKKSPKNLKLGASVTFVVILVATNLNVFSVRDWSIASCDVGQGDSTLIRTHKNSAVMVDTGDNPKVLRQCLETFAIEHVDTLIITHMHQDHYGAFEVLGDFNLKKVLIPTSYVTPEFRAKLLNISPSVIEATTGYFEDHLYGRWNIVQVGKAGGESGADINNSGIVVFAWSKGVNALLLADVEIEAQAKLIASAPEWNINIVKIAHHGSRYQHPELAMNLSAQFGWISVGQDNSYSHPHPEMISLYKSVGTQLYSTALCGHLYYAPQAREIRTSRACEPL